MEMEDIMSSIKVEGMEEYLRLLDLSQTKLKTLCGRSIHPGAGLIYKDCRKRINGLATEKGGHHGNTKRRLTEAQREGLAKSLGIAKLRNKRGTFDVKLGFDGYNSVVTKRWPNGQPNAMIARSVNKGTSFMPAQPFMDRSIEACRHPVEEKIEEQFYKELEKLWGKWFDKH